MLKDIGFMNRTAMAAGNAGKFDTAFKNMNQALTLTHKLNKNCLTAKLLNNQGNLHTMAGQWDKALLSYEQSMSIVAEHYGADNILYKTLQKNLVYLLTLDVTAA